MHVALQQSSVNFSRQLAKDCYMMFDCTSCKILPVRVLHPFPVRYYSIWWRWHTFFGWTFFSCVLPHTCLAALGYNRLTCFRFVTTSLFVKLQHLHVVKFCCNSIKYKAGLSFCVCFQTVKCECEITVLTLKVLLESKWLNYLKPNLMCLICAIADNFYESVHQHPSCLWHVGSFTRFFFLFKFELNHKNGFTCLNLSK